MKLLPKLLLSVATAGAISVIPTAGFSEDIDIYVGGTTGGAPNVLFVFDNSAAFEASATNTCRYLDDNAAPSLGNTVGGVQQCALYNIIYGLKTDAVNIGLMVFNENNMKDRFGTACGTSALGGCLVSPLTAINTANKASLLTWIRSWSTGGGGSDRFNIKSNTARTGQVMQEAWAYYAGARGMSGRNYASIQPSPGCQRNFVVFVGNATGNNDKPGDGGSPPHDATLAAAPGITSALRQSISIPEGTYGTTKFSCKGTYSYRPQNHSETSGLYADEWSRYMFQTDLYSTFDEKQSITSYTVGFMGPNCTPDYPALLTSTAKVGGGKYFPTTDYAELKAAFDAILTEVQAVNSVFSSASLPVSVNAQGTFENQIFLGMFRPDGEGDPRWVGNLKQFQFILDYPDPTNPDPNKATLKLGDALGNEALSSAGTGFISPSAVSFWTKQDDAPGFFVNDPKGNGGAFDYPDGEFVEKGGAAQVMRNKSLTSTNYSALASGPRRLFTYCPAISGITALLCPTSTSSDLTRAENAFSAGNAGLALAGLNAELINWVAGQDNKANDEAGPGSPVTVRPSIHGDVIHSRPVVINYGDTRGTVVFYGANDGMYRAVNGSQTQAIGTTPPGGELWALVAPEHFGQLKRLRDNDPDLKFSTTNVTGTRPKDYFFDGSTGLYQTLKADGKTTNEAILYVTMRRGGRFMYAIDVADPVNPKVLWRISNSSAGFAELGQTWSRPRLALTNLPDSATGGSTTLDRPVLVFGGGYSGGYDGSGNPLGEDAEPPKANTMGRAIYVVNALTGERIWSAQKSCGGLTNCKEVSSMDWSIPADLSFVDRNNDGRTDRLYAADVGGNIWRVDINDADVSKWEVTRLAALGCDSGACDPAKPGESAAKTQRKFFFPPSVISVGATGAAGSFDALLIGSGDREHPLANVSLTTDPRFVRDRFYMIKDTATGMSATARASGSPSLPITEASLDALATADSRYTRDTSDGGFYITFSTGEKVVNAPTTVRGTTFFGTNRPTPPSNTSCSSNLGLARGYALDPFTGALSSVVYDGGGLPPSPTPGLVTITLPPTTPGGDPSTVTKLFCIGCGGGDPNNASGDRTDGGPGREGGGSGSDEADCRSAVGNCPPVKDVPKDPRRTYWYVR